MLVEIPVQTLEDDFAHTLPTCIFDISEPNCQITREFDSSPLEYISSSAGEGVGGSRRRRWVEVVLCQSALVALRVHSPSARKDRDVLSLFHLTFLNLSKFISYSAYLKKSSFLVCRLINEVSNAVLRFVI